jgi:Flp pilus assembly protein TadG
MERRNRFDQLRGEGGSSLVEMAMVMPLFMLLLLGAIDFGRAFYMSTEVAGAAQAAAVYGSQNPTDTAGIKSAAQDDAPNLTLSFPTLSYSCECSDGTLSNAGCTAPPTCSGATEVTLVQVTVTTTYTPLFPWPGVPSSIQLSSSASMRG